MSSPAERGDQLREALLVLDASAAIANPHYVGERWTDLLPPGSLVFHTRTEIVEWLREQGHIERTEERERWRTTAQLLFDFICREWPEAREVVQEYIAQAERPLPPGPPDPSSRHLWGLAGPQNGCRGGAEVNSDREQEIRREHRHALATHPTPTDSWLNGYQRDVGDLLELLDAERALRQQAEQEAAATMNAYTLASEELAQAEQERDKARRERDKWSEISSVETLTKVIAEARVASLEQALTEDREKWSFATLLFVADRLLAEQYPETVFPRDKQLDEGDVGPRLVRALRLAVEDCRAALGVAETKQEPPR